MKPRAPWLLPAVLVACVPSGSAPPWDAGSGATAVATAPRQAPGVMTAVFEDDFERGDAAGAWLTDGGPVLAAGTGPWLKGPDASPAPVGPREGGLGGEAGPGMADATAAALQALGQLQQGPAIANGGLGPNWTQTRDGFWRIEGGKLCGQGAKNHGVWLNRVLPVNARIEFDAVSYSPEGDLKCEVWGDGRSSATGESYTNATSYLAIFGGWKNTYHVLARIDEHATDRKEIKIDATSDDPRQKPVVAGQMYRFKVERTDGKTVRWSVNGLEYLTYPDPSPLAGVGHDHFGFNEWKVKVCFDNVKVTPL